MIRNFLFNTTVFVLFFNGLAIEPGAAQDADALAKTSQNPLATMVTLPLQFNFNDGVGPYGREMFNLNVQPVLPITGDEWNLIVRPIIPINSVPQGQTDSTFGLGDTTLQLFITPATSGSLAWGLGPVFGLPTASNQEVLGSGKWGAGVGGVVFYQVGNWTMGGLVSNLWSIAGDSHREDYNHMTLQYFLNYNFGGAGRSAHHRLLRLTGRRIQTNAGPFPGACRFPR